MRVQDNYGKNAVDSRYLQLIIYPKPTMQFIRREQWVLCLLLLMGCLPASSPEKKPVANDTIKPVDEQQMVMQPDSLAVAREDDTFYIPKTAKIKVLSLAHTVTDTSNAAPFKTWRLNAAAVEKIIRNGHPADGPTIHYRYSTLPCNVSGSVQIDQDTFHYRINAGSYFYLYNDRHSSVYTCTAANCRRFFMEGEEDPAAY